MRIGYEVLRLLLLVSVAPIAVAGGHSDAAPSGKVVFEASCANCHTGGFGGFFSGAPKVGDQADWAPLIVKGVDKLTANTLAGIGDMTARGGCESCTDEEIAAAVAYMVEQSR